MKNENKYIGESFLNRLYKDLYNSDEVVHTAINSDTKDEKVRKYLERLKKVEELAKDSKYNGLELLKKMYYDKYLIKEENVSESYFELQKKMALERGMGHIEITEDMKKQLIKDIIDDQKSSLDTWLDYLINDDANYPEWFKYYAFQGMIKLGSYDKKTKTFSKRTPSTTNIFVDLNREALALVYDDLCEVLNGKKVDDEVLQKLLVGGSFSKLYSYTLELLDKNNKSISDSNQGIWVKYNEGSEPDELVNSLKGKGTGWCTVGKETARQQLELGDFYVYYTKDSNNEFKQPRIAIRMEESEISEIRGIDEQQNLEPEMEEILEEKLKEFPDSDKYKKKVNNMKKLTDIYNEYKDRELTIEELRFLYEVDEQIEGFGYEEDPRIGEILDGRNIKEDLAKVFNCKQEQISDNPDDVLAGKEIVYFYDRLILDKLTSIEDIKLPQHVMGSLDLSNLTSTKNLVLPETIGGSLSLNSLEDAEGLMFPKAIGGSLFLNKLTDAKDLILSEKIGETIFLPKLTSAKNIIFPKAINGSLNLESLTSFKDLKLPENIGESLYLSDLTSIIGLVLPKTIGEDLDLSGLISAKGLILPEKIGSDLNLGSLTSAEGLILPKIINGTLNLNNLISAKGLVFPKSIGNSLCLGSLEDAKGLILPETIDSDLDLSSLTSAEGLTLPKIINGTLELDNLTSVKDLVLPENIGESLYLGNLTSAIGLVLPKTIGDDLDLSGLINAKGLILPESIGGSIYLSNLTSSEGLVLPHIIKSDLNLESLTSAKGLTLPETIGYVLYLNNLENTDGLIVPKNFNCKYLESNYITMDDLKRSSENSDIKSK